MDIKKEVLDKKVDLGNIGEIVIIDEKLVLVGENRAKWNSGDKMAFIVQGKYWVNNHAHVLRPHKGKIINDFLVHILNQMDLKPYISGITVPKLNQKNLCSIKVPLPPLDIQKGIVAEIEVYQKNIDGAKQVVDNGKPTIKIDPKYPMVEVSEVMVFKLMREAEKKWRRIRGYGEVKNILSGSLYKDGKRVQDDPRSARSSLMGHPQLSGVSLFMELMAW